MYDSGGKAAGSESRKSKDHVFNNKRKAQCEQEVG